MQNPEKETKIQELLKLLEDKYAKEGQDLTVHLEGLLNSKYLNYWDYIHLDALLNLQVPKTDYSDELMFIIYHQITELYFKMILHEINNIRKQEIIDKESFFHRLNRVNWFFGQQIQSFDIISIGMEQEQFLKFRTALHPASGFQSVQYRMTEIASTDFINLVSKDHRDDFHDYSTIDQMFEKIYWKKGAIDVATGRKTLTLKQFEEKYSEVLIRFANDCVSTNLWSIFKRLPFEAQEDERLISEMRKYDTYANINWPLAHYKYAVSYLIRSKQIVPSTGGTNWQKYLPPRFQKQIFFPSLWSEQELQDWGKSWVESEVFAHLM
ncbi:tryptophan 2,3-dioxygenase [Sporocytophaga myxococcoides]|uniref:Tryptophan 2,3-dioxygenase n=1 Tax=Sporocytophaga myxococcoides TaxID=153721 RepID=A0A098LFZ3_9BACT|nr:tryptophan 2,3-dioxygenase family protein [Sporocytophaga myxococcoides]GAL85018.1 tryptophan 2,3-dioxygenase [Sporocytophaga myxococcoides]